MSKIKVELDLKGINELMKSPEMQGVLLDYGKAVAHAAGPEYDAEVHNTARWLAISNVYPNSQKAAKDNYENNTLLKAVSIVQAVGTMD